MTREVDTAAPARLTRPFWVALASVAATNLGDGITLTALPLLTASLTDDARLIAIVAAARFVPFVVLGLPLGWLVDHVDRRRLIVAVQLLRAGVMGGFAIAVATGAESVALVAAVSFGIGAGEVVADSGMPAIVRTLVRREQLEVANARLSAVETVANVFVGPLAGALLFGVGTSWPIAADGACFVAAAALLGAVSGSFRVTAADIDPVAVPARGLTSGLRYVWSHPLLRPLALAVAWFAFVNAAGNAVFVVLATQRLGLGELGFGLLATVAAASSIATTFVVGRVIHTIGHAGSMRLSAALNGGFGLVLGLTANVPAAAGAAVLEGASGPLWNVVSQSLRQRVVPDAIFGRMMSAYLFVSWSTIPVGAIVGGLVAEAWGVEWVFLSSAGAMVLLVVSGKRLFRAVSATMAAETSPPA